LHRTPHRDAELHRLNAERDHLAIKLSLAKDAGVPDLKAVARLERTIADLEIEIRRHRPDDA
jgi:hypothetical protein